MKNEVRFSIFITVIIITVLLSLHYFQNTFLKLETDHIKIYCDRSTAKALEDYVNDLDDFYQYAANILGLTIHHPIEIKIYPNRKLFNRGTLFSVWSDKRFRNVTAEDRVIKVLSYKDKSPNVTFESMLDSIKHSMVLVVIHDNSNNYHDTEMPMWIAQGIPHFIRFNENEDFNNRVKQKEKFLIENGFYEPLLHLEFVGKGNLYNSSPQLNPYLDRNGEFMGYSMVNYLYNKYGGYILNKLITERNYLVKNGYYQSFEEFVREWENYIVEKHQ